MAVDPVCKMDVNEAESTESMEHEGKKVYFCSEDCKKQFQDDPELFTEQAA
jgi:YHS domain-containing protein